MLIRFECENYKSIKERIVLNMEATADKSHGSNIIHNDGMRILRAASIYGANGSGKSNVINAISFVQALVLNSMHHQPGQTVFQAPHRLSLVEAPSKYRMVFTTNGVKYDFGFTVKHGMIVEEYLYCFPSKRKVVVYTREDGDITEGSKYKGLFELGKNVLKDNRLFLSCAANYSNSPEVVEPFLFFRDKMIVYDAAGSNEPVNNDWIGKSVQLLSTNKAMKKEFLGVLKRLGTGITDIKTKFETRKATPSDFPGMPNEIVKSIVENGPLNTFAARVVYKRFETDLMSEESSGIRKLFELLCPIIDTIKDDKLFICDEIEAAFHELYVKEILGMFNSFKENASAQIIFSTHNTNLLDYRFFRRDQIWFTQLIAPDRQTDLYPLSSIKGVRNNEKFSTQYINGKYGAIPILNESFASYANND